MSFSTSAAIDALALELAALRGQTPDEAIASALRSELLRERQALAGSGADHPEPGVEELMARISSLGPWRGPTGAEMTAELYDNQGLPR